jgi:hypothetical protein
MVKPKNFDTLCHQYSANKLQIAIITERTIGRPTASTKYKSVVYLSKFRCVHMSTILSFPGVLTKIIGRPSLVMSQGEAITKLARDVGLLGISVALALQKH